jgi:uncharacterized protein (TIGR02001 family)
MKTLTKSLIATALLTTGIAAQAEVSGGAAIASSYLWRGFDLSAGSAAVSGSLDYSHESGLYAGIWGSSGDDTAGTEYDLYGGFGGEVGDIGYDIGYVNYKYPNSVTAEFEEIYVGLSYGDFGITVYDNDDADYTYVALSADLGDFNITYGDWSTDGSHIDLTYGTGDLAFTLSQASGADYAGSSAKEETQFVVSYSIPLDM